MGTLVQYGMPKPVYAIKSQGHCNHRRFVIEPQTCAVDSGLRQGFNHQKPNTRICQNTWHPTDIFRIAEHILKLRESRVESGLRECLYIPCLRKLARAKKPRLLCRAMCGIRCGFSSRMPQQLRLLIKRLDMQEVQHALLQNIDVFGRLNPKPPHHLLYWSLLIQLCSPRYGITAVVLDLGESIRTLQIHPELRSSIESLSQ